MGDLNDGTNKLVDGAQALKDGADTLKDGTGKLSEGTGKLADGTGKLYDGAGTLADGTAKLYDGTGTLRDGAGTLASGTATLRDGIAAYTSGVSQVNDGAAALAKGATSAKQGSAALKDGAGNLAAGATTLDNSVGQLSQLLPTYKDKLNVISGTMTESMTTLYTKKAKLQATQKFLASGNPEDWNAYVAEMIAEMAGRGVSCEEAVALVQGAKKTMAASAEETPALPSPEEAAAAKAAAAQASAGTETTQTTNVDTPDNFEELTLEATGDTLTEDEGDDESEPEVTQPETVVIEDEATPASAAPETKSLDLTNVKPAGTDASMLGASLTQDTGDAKTIEDYQKLVSELEQQLKAAQTEAATYKAAAQEYGAKAQAAADGMNEYYNAALQYRTGVEQLKTGVGAVAQYEQLVGATDAAIAAID